MHKCDVYYIENQPNSNELLSFIFNNSMVSIVNLHFNETEEYESPMIKFQGEIVYGSLNDFLTHLKGINDALSPPQLEEFTLDLQEFDVTYDHNEIAPAPTEYKNLTDITGIDKMVELEMSYPDYDNLFQLAQEIKKNIEEQLSKISDAISPIDSMQNYGVIGPTGPVSLVQSYGVTGPTGTVLTAKDIAQMEMDKEAKSKGISVNFLLEENYRDEIETGKSKNIEILKEHSLDNSVLSVEFYKMLRKLGKAEFDKKIIQYRDEYANDLERFEYYDDKFAKFAHFKNLVSKSDLVKYYLIKNMMDNDLLDAEDDFAIYIHIKENINTSNIPVSALEESIKIKIEELLIDYDDIESDDEDDNTIKI